MPFWICRKSFESDYIGKLPKNPKWIPNAPFVYVWHGLFLPSYFTI